MPTPGLTTAFEKLYADQYPVLTVQLYAYTGDLPRAHALTQEAFCRALADWPRIVKQDEPGAWVRRAAWRLATSRWRRVTDVVRRSPAPSTSSPTSTQPNSEQREMLAALRALPARPRRVFLMHYLAGRTLAEISEQEHVKLRRITAALDRAQTTLAPRLVPAAQAAIANG